METFEVEAHGQTFEIEAPDQATALKAFAKMAGMQQEGGNLPSIPVPGIEEAQDFSRAFQSGATQGMTLGFGDEMYAGVTAPFRAGYNMLFNGAEDFDLGRGWEEGLASARGGLEADAARNPAANMAGDIAGSVLLGGTAAKGGLTLMNGIKPTVASIAPRAAAEGAIYGGASGFGRADGDLGERATEAMDGALWGAAAGGLIGAGTGAVLGRSAKAAVPSVDDLKGDARALYDAADASGVTFARPEVKTVADDIAAAAISEGLDPTLHPRATAALQRLMQAGTTGMTVRNAQTMRRILAAAGKDPLNPDEARIAKLMIDKFDDMVAAKSPELAQARAVYHQAKKGELIEQTIELARSRAGQYSNGGMENALRTEFRALQRKLIKGQLKGLSPEEVAAINKVADGGSLDNIARWVGKAAPTGIVSAGLGTGVPFAIGNAVGGPAMGAAAAAGTMGAGIVGKTAAEAMTSANAVKAALIARNGGVSPTASPLRLGQEQVTRALIASGGNEAARIPKVPIEILVTGGAR